MTSWLDLVENCGFLSGLYPGGAPSLTSVDLHEATLHRDGPCMTLRFDLGEFPPKPPANWQSAAYNALQVRMILIGLDHVRLTGWTTQPRGSVAIDARAKGGLGLCFSGDGVTIEAAADVIRLDGLSPYVRT